MDDYKYKATRSLLYLAIASGLLFFAAAFVRWFANRAIVSYFNLPDITFLESIGIASIFGAILASIKYGFFNHIDFSLEALQNYAENQREEFIEKKSNKIQEKISKMNKQQKEELKTAISKFIGYDDSIK